MKQTLFEAEAVITVDTSKMFAQLSRDAQRARRELEKMLGGVQVPTGGGGRGGGGGGGGARSSRTDPFGLEMSLARQERAAGKYAQAIERVNQLLSAQNLSQKQIVQAETLKEAIQRRQLANQARIVKRGEDAKEQAIKDASRPGARSAINPFALEMDDIKLAAHQKNYVTALAKTNQLLQQNLTTRQRLAALRAQDNIINNMSAGGLGAGGRGNNGGVNPTMRRANAVTQNASFAIQDFVTVLSMGGGMSRALASASNNLAFMTSMMGTVGGAVAGLAITLAAVFAPALIRLAAGFEEAGTGADRLKKKIEDLADALNLFRSRAQNKFDVEDIVTGMQTSGDSTEFDREIKDTKRKLEIEEGALKTAQEEASGARSTAVRNFFRQMGRSDDELLPVEVDWMQRVMSGQVTPTDVRDDAANTPDLEEIYSGRATKLEELAKALDEINEPSQKSAKEIQNLQERLEALNKGLTEDAWKLPAEDWTKDGTFESGAEFGEAVEQDKRMRRKEKDAEIKSLREQVPAIKGIFETLFPKESQIEDIKKQYEDAFGKDMPASARAMMDAQIAEVKNPRTSITGQMGGAEFAGQLTNQLLKSDPQTKIAQEAEKHTDLLDLIKTATEKAATRLETLETSSIGE